MESSSKIYELYHSYDHRNSSINNNDNNTNNNIISKNASKANTIKIKLTNGPKNKQNQNNSKINNFMLTDQGKRIQEYRNKYNTLTDKGNNDNNHVDIFGNANFNIKNNENKPLNGNNEINHLHYLEKRKKEIDDLIKVNEINSKSAFNSQSDIPQVNTSFFTNKNILNNNSNLNFSLFNEKNNSQSSMELAKNMKIKLEHIRENLNKQKKNI